MSARTPARTPAVPGAPNPETLTHPCVRCGAPVPLDIAMCERCNPLGLSQPAPTQAHGTAALGVIIAVVVLAVVGKLAIAGVGPFSGSIASVASDPPNLALTLTVRNEGTRDGQTTCRVYDPAQGAGIGPNAVFVDSPQIKAGQTLSFSKVVTGLGSEARPLGVECTSP
jgi:hypothetical protein